MHTDPTLPFASGGKKPQDADGVDLEFKQWQASPTPVTRSNLLRKVQPSIDTALRSYSGGTPSPNLRSQAKLMALKAFETYDPSRGNLHTHIISQLQGLRRVSGKERQILAMPERVALDQQHLAESTTALEDKLGRPPSDMELADHTGLSQKRLSYIRQGRQAINTGSTLDEEGGPAQPGGQLPGDTGNERAWENFVYHDLGPVDQSIMDATLGRNGGRPRSTSEIARRLGITPSAVSQRKAKIQAMLDERLHNSILR